MGDLEKSLAEYIKEKGLIDSQSTVKSVIVSHTNFVNNEAQNTYITVSYLYPYELKYERFIFININLNDFKIYMRKQKIKRITSVHFAS